eukprot:759083-Hanusia_phi.AAC.2
MVGLEGDPSRFRKPPEVSLSRGRGEEWGYVAVLLLQVTSRLTADWLGPGMLYESLRGELVRGRRILSRRHLQASRGAIPVTSVHREGRGSKAI